VFPVSCAKILTCCVLLLPSAGLVQALDKEQVTAAARGVLYARPDLNAELVDAEVNGSALSLYFDSGLLTRERLSGLGEAALAAIYRVLSVQLLNEGVADASFSTFIAGKPLVDWLEPAPQANESAGPLNSAPAAPLVALGPGHGYYFHATLGWTTQRSNYFGVVEDFLNLDMLLPVKNKLETHGFSLLTLREFDKTAGVGESGFSKWRESTRTYLRSLGVSPSIWDSSADATAAGQISDDIRARPLYANAMGAGLFISLHNNAGGGTGTETLYDTTNGLQAESKRFADIVQARMVSRIRGQYLPSWSNRGVKGFAGDYGENRLARCPSVIIEAAFFDKKSPDNDAQQDPRFREIVAQAISDSVAEYFEQPALEFASEQVDDDTLNESRGDGDGLIEAGETIELKVALRNSGFGIATGVTGRVSVSDPFVSLQDADTSWLDLVQGATVLSSGDFGFIIATNCPAGHTFELSFIFESAQGTWTARRTYEVTANNVADLLDAGASFHTLAPSTVAPGSSVTFGARLRNAGTTAAPTSEVRFYLSPDAAISTSDIVLGNGTLPAVGTGSFQPFTVSVPVSPSLPAGRYFVGWLLDAGAVVTELEETNNIVLGAHRLTVQPPGSEVQIIQVRLVGAVLEDVAVEFSTKPGYHYALERSIDLRTWTRLFSAIAGTGTPLQRTDVNALANQGRLFYRVVEE